MSHQFYDLSLVKFTVYLFSLLFPEVPLQAIACYCYNYIPIPSLQINIYLSNQNILSTHYFHPKSALGNHVLPNNPHLAKTNNIQGGPRADHYKWGEITTINGRK